MTQKLVSSSSSVVTLNNITTPNYLKLKQGIGNWEAIIAIKNRNLKLIQTMLEDKLDPNLDFRGNTLLVTAIHENSLEILLLLLKYGTDPNKKSNQNDRNEPPIITATRLKHLHLVIALVEHGADLSNTNFYGEDAIYKAIIQNAFGILIYFLSTKPHGSCVHRSDTVCPLRRAILDAEYYPSKRKSLLILLKYRYHCSCIKNLNNRNNYFQLMNLYRNREVRREVMQWVNLSYGINLEVTLLQVPVQVPVQVPEVRIPVVDNRIMPIVNESTQIILLDLPQINLNNLVRNLIRKIVSDFATQQGTIFLNEISKLPLPSTLIKFLLMGDLPVPI